MASTRPRRREREFGRRGDEFCECGIRFREQASREGQFAAIDIETGADEIDTDTLGMSNRPAARIPNAQIWLWRVGSRRARRFGLRAVKSYRRTGLGVANQCPS